MEFLTGFATRIQAAALGLIALAACTAPQQAERQACDAYAGADEVAALAASHIIVFGEAIHGTEESPAAFYGLACTLARKGTPVLVGLEAEHPVSGALDAFLDAPGDVDGLYQGAAGMWSVHDGRSSEAVLELLRKLSGLRAEGADITVFAFDATAEDWVGAANGSVARDAVMAENVDAAASGREGAILLLTGGFHARKADFSLGDMEFEPMASKITARPALSLEMNHAGGTAWMWGEVDGEPFKGAITLSNTLPEDAPVHAFVLEPTPTGADGAYYTGPITASPPAFPAASPS